MLALLNIRPWCALMKVIKNSSDTFHPISIQLRLFEEVDPTRVRSLVNAAALSRQNDWQIPRNFLEDLSVLVSCKHYCCVCAARNLFQTCSHFFREIIFH